jgi:hypothetical protein
MVKISSLGTKTGVLPPCLTFRWAVRLYLALIGLILCFMLSSLVEDDNGKGALSFVLQSMNRTDPRNMTMTVQPVTKRITIGYAVVITGCGSSDNSAEEPFPIAEGGAVLKYSIAQHATTTKARYDYALYAIHHPDAIECAKTLEPLGYTLIERNTPVAVADIQGDYLREKIVKNGWYVLFVFASRQKKGIIFTHLTESTQLW